MAAIEFIDLKAQRERLGTRIQTAMERVLEHGRFILGPEVSQLEELLADYCGVKHTVTCANGTDALTLVLMCENIGPGDVVFVPDFTFVATAEAVAQLGATPFMVDVEEDSFNICPKSLQDAWEQVDALDLTPKAVIAVDLFGQPANYAALREFTHAHNLVLIADAAQSFGASQHGKKVGSLADYTTTSFFPAKPLGCYGDGGAIFVQEDRRADLLRSLRFHGKGDNKYNNVRIGLNSRLDSLQAAILIEKLSIFDEELALKERLASRYIDQLRDFVKVPSVTNETNPNWALFTIKSQARDVIKDACQSQSIPTVVYYPTPVSRAGGYIHLPTNCAESAISQKLSQTVLSLPMHAYLSDAEQDKIIEVVTAAVTGQE